MPNDQLTRPERLRLEALAQAIASCMTMPIGTERPMGISLEDWKLKKLAERAEAFEKFLYAANEARRP